MGAVLARATELNPTSLGLRTFGLDGPSDSQNGQDAFNSDQEAPELPETVRAALQIPPFVPEPDNENTRKICGDKIFFSDKQRDMYIACCRSDYDLATCITAIDRSEAISNNRQAPTLQGNARQARGNCIAVLHSMPLAFKQSCILGTLMEDLHKARFKDMVDQYAAGDRKSIGNPVIYVNFLIDEHGKPPTGRQVEKIVAAVRRYIDGLEELHRRIVRPDQSPENGLWIRNVDANLATGRANYSLASSERLRNSERRYIRTASDLQAINRWCELIEVRLGWLQRTKPAFDMDKPMTQLHASDVGWTYEPGPRRYAHETHQSGSISTMNLVDSIARIELGQTYRVTNRNVLSVLTQDLASMSEHVVSRLCFTYEGHGGFNRVIAGRSVDAATKVSSDVYRQVQNKYARVFMEAFNKQAQWTEQALAYARDEVDRRNTVEYYETTHIAWKETERKLPQLFEDVKKAEAELDSTTAQYISGMEKKLDLLEEAQRGVKWMEDSEDNIRRIWTHFCA